MLAVAEGSLEEEKRENHDDEEEEEVLLDCSEGLEAEAASAWKRSMNFWSSAASVEGSFGAPVEEEGAGGGAAGLSCVDVLDLSCDEDDDDHSQPIL